MNIHKVFKPARKNDAHGAAYLYPDGHVVAVFHRHELGTRLTYVKVAQSIGITTSNLNRGRIIFHSHMALAAAAAFCGHVTLFCDNTTEPDRAKGVRHDTVEISSRYGHFSLEDSSLHGGTITAQTGSDEHTETYAQTAGGEREWSTYPIVEIYPNEPEDS
jgi:hypothetical protein